MEVWEIKHAIEFMLFSISIAFYSHPCRTFNSLHANK